MNHPLTRIFAPIAMIIFVAASTVLVSTSNDSEFTSEPVMATAMASDAQSNMADQQDLD